MRGESSAGGEEAADDGLGYTRLFTSGLRIGIPWDRLVSMPLTVLVMMVSASHPRARGKGRKTARAATQADIDAFLV